MSVRSARPGPLAVVPAVLGGAGCLAVFLTARSVSMSSADAVDLSVTALASAAAVSLAGWGVLRFLWGRPLGVQVAVVALSAVLAVALGAWAVANAMFVSKHDLHVLTVVLVAAGVAGTGSAFFLGRRVEGASRSLVEQARRIGAGDVSPGVEAAALPTTELAVLAREIDQMSVALEQARRRERALEGSRRELVAWMSHDLRRPLAAIRAMAEALENGVVADDLTVAHYHHRIVTEVDRLTALVDDLFELSRTQADVLDLRLEPISFSELVSDALTDAVSVAGAKGVRLVGQFQGSGADLHLSTPEVARALSNLLENAIRHTPSDGTVLIEAGVDGEAAYVSVSDACGGMPDVDLDRVFDVAFHREAVPTPGTGSGLELAIARGMVEAHGGEITVGNEGAGCRFTVRLPLRNGSGPD